MKLKLLKYLRNFVVVSPLIVIATFSLYIYGFADFFLTIKMLLITAGSVGILLFLAFVWLVVVVLLSELYDLNLKNKRNISNDKTV